MVSESNTMKHNIILGVLLCVGGSACDTLPGTHYNVYIDPGFTPDQQQGVLQAMEQWTKVIPSLQLTPFLGNCSGIHTHEICIHPSYQDADNGTELGVTFTKPGPGTKGTTGGGGTGVDGGEIWLYIPSIQDDVSNHPQVFTQTATHELGHAMGLLHHTDVPCIMYPFINSTDAQGAYETTYPTTDDVEQWYYVR
jgi:Matrixin